MEREIENDGSDFLRHISNFRSHPGRNQLSVERKKRPFYLRLESYISFISRLDFWRQIYIYIYEERRHFLFSEMSRYLWGLTFRLYLHKVHLTNCLLDFGLWLDIVFLLSQRSCLTGLYIETRLIPFWKEWLKRGNEAMRDKSDNYSSATIAKARAAAFLFSSAVSFYLQLIIIPRVRHIVSYTPPARSRDSQEFGTGL